MDRRNFLKGIAGAGVAVAASKVAPAGLVKLECTGCGGILAQVGDFFECESCGAKYALGGVVMQTEDEPEPKRVMEDLHCFGDSTGATSGATSCSTWRYQGYPPGYRVTDQGDIVMARDEGFR